MNIVIKTGVFIFTLIAIGLVGISTAPMVDDVFADQNIEDEYITTNESPSNSPINIADKPEKCSPWDPRC